MTVRLTRVDMNATGYAFVTLTLSCPSLNDKCRGFFLHVLGLAMGSSAFLKDWFLKNRAVVTSARQFTALACYEWMSSIRFEIGALHLV